MNYKLLITIPLLRDWRKEELESLAKISRVCFLKPGEIIFREGKPSKIFYFVLKGRVKIYKIFRKKEETLAILVPGHFFCENALVDTKAIHTQNALSLEKNQLVQIKTNDFLRLVKKNPQVANKLLKKIVKILTDRLYHADNRLVTVYNTGKILGRYRLRENIEGLARAILKTILQAIRARRAIFALYPKERREILIVETIGFKDGKKIKNLVLKIDEDPLLGKVAQEAKTLFISPLESRKLKITYLKKSALAVPISIGGQAIGSLLLLDKKSAKGFNINNQILLEIIAKQIASTVEEAMLVEKEKAEEELKRVYVRPM